MHAGQYAYRLESESRAGRTSGTSTWERKPGLREGDDINFTFDAEFNPYRGTSLHLNMRVSARQCL